MLGILTLCCTSSMLNMEVEAEYLVAHACHGGKFLEAESGKLS